MHNHFHYLEQPVTKVAGCMAVPSSLPGVFPSNVAVLALAEIQKDFPELAQRLAMLAVDACGERLPSEAASAAEGVPRIVTPPSNTGVNKTTTFARGSK